MSRHMWRVPQLFETRFPAAQDSLCHVNGRDKVLYNNLLGTPHSSWAGLIWFRQQQKLWLVCLLCMLCMLCMLERLEDPYPEIRSSGWISMAQTAPLAWLLCMLE